jgi:hypothetical protein
LNIDKAAGNPYAPPQSILTSRPVDECGRDGKVLIVPAGASLPERCIKCNKPATMDKPRSFSWHSPGWYLLLLLAVLIYIVVGMTVRRKVKIAIGLCEVHRRRRRALNWTAIASLLVACAAFFGAAKLDVDALGWIGVLALLVTVIVALVASSSLSPVGIDDSGARFRGCGKAFLDSLPEH